MGDMKRRFRGTTMYNMCFGLEQTANLDVVEEKEENTDDSDDSDADSSSGTQVQQPHVCSICRMAQNGSATIRENTGDNDGIEQLKAKDLEIQRLRQRLD